jgi:uncharacterized membrane protein
MDFTKNKFILLVFCTALLGSCSHRADTQAWPQVSFKGEIQPVVVANCTANGCHGTSNGNQEELFPLVTYQDVITIVQPGDARSSRLYTSITGNSENIMPPASQAMLTDNQIKQIYLWIEEGAKNN